MKDDLDNLVSLIGEARLIADRILLEAVQGGAQLYDSYIRWDGLVERKQILPPEIEAVLAIPGVHASLLGGWSRRLPPQMVVKHGDFEEDDSEEIFHTSNMRCAECPK
jgi:hypothetical protein